MNSYYFKDEKSRKLNKVICSLCVFDAMSYLVDWVAKNDIELLQVIVFDSESDVVTPYDVHKDGWGVTR